MIWQIEMEFAERIFYINRESLKKYADASGDQNPIHQSEEFAKSVGLPNVIAHGMFTMALAGEAVRSWIGSERFILEFNTRFAKPVIIPAGVDVAVSFTGKVIALTGEDLTIEVAAICDGNKVLNQTKVRVKL
ncbi:MAG: dehydratase [Actinobacteria bacterium]|uniref:Dehydratase n=1 Tax=Candidatus Fonsibacter lacus TaxID=2576439 RepID=A0A965GBU5_9PROT|nr:dehydratase [Candidatus Fonsibacter lacus]